MKFMYEDEKTAIQFEIEKMILLVNFLLREHFVKTKLEDFEQKYFFELGYKETYLALNMLQDYLFNLEEKI